MCDENPLSDIDSHFYACTSVLHKNTSKMEILFKGCYVDRYDSYNETCVLEEYPTTYYSCVCNATLCNSNGSLIIPPFKTPSTGIP